MIRPKILVELALTPRLGSEAVRSDRAISSMLSTAISFEIPSLGLHFGHAMRIQGLANDQP
jgi:hypothetical protein